MGCQPPPGLLGAETGCACATHSWHRVCGRFGHCCGTTVLCHTIACLQARPCASTATPWCPRFVAPSSCSCQGWRDGLHVRWCGTVELKQCQPWLWKPSTPPPPMPMDLPCQWPSPLERRNMAPLANAPPPLERRNMPPPPRVFFTKLHTNCPFLPSFLSVQWHVMSTILGVMCLFFQCRYSFLDVPSPVWSSLRLSGLACIATRPCWPEPMCTIACFSRPGVISFNHHFFWSCSCAFSSCLLLCACMCEEGKAWKTNVEHHNKDGVKA